MLTGQVIFDCGNIQVYHGVSLCLHFVYALCIYCEYRVRTRFGNLLRRVKRSVQWKI